MTEHATESVADTFAHLRDDDARCPTCSSHPYRPRTDHVNDHACVDVCHYIALVHPSSYATRFSSFHKRRGARLRDYCGKIVSTRQRASQRLSEYVSVSGVRW